MPPPLRHHLARNAAASQASTGTQGSNRASPEPVAAEPVNAGPVVAAPEYPIDNNIYVRRIRKEIDKMMSDPTEGCKVELVDNCIHKWKAIILGPVETPYEGGHFELMIHLPPMYPCHPPTLHFLTHIYHCNISFGIICMDILDANWSPVLTVENLILTVQSLLTDPNPDDAINRWAALTYKRNREKYNRLARRWTALYAQPAASSLAGQSEAPPP